MVHLRIIALTVATATIHFSRAIADPEIRILFILNGIGYLVLLAGLYLPQLNLWRPFVRRLLIGYTLLTIALFVLWGQMSGEWSTIGLVDKAIEIVLVGLLLHEERARPREA